MAKRQPVKKPVVATEILNAIEPEIQVKAVEEFKIGFMPVLDLSNVVPLPKPVVSDSKPVDKPLSNEEQKVIDYTSTLVESSTYQRLNGKALPLMQQSSFDLQVAALEGSKAEREELAHQLACSALFDALPKGFTLYDNEGNRLSTASGNPMRINRLYKAMSRNERKERFLEWIVEHGPFHVQKDKAGNKVGVAFIDRYANDKGKFRDVKGKLEAAEWDIEGAMAEPFFVEKEAVKEDVLKLSYFAYLEGLDKALEREYKKLTEPKIGKKTVYFEDGTEHSDDLDKLKLELASMRDKIAQRLKLKEAA